MRGGTRPRISGRKDRGAVAIITALMMVVFMIAASFVVDLGMVIVKRGAVQNAADSGVLAAAAYLPDDPVAAEAAAIRFVRLNEPDIPLSSIAVSFRCLIGDRDDDGRPDLGDVPGACDPGSGAPFTCDRGICTAPCYPNLGHTCNTIVVDTSESVPYSFGPAGGLPGSGTTGEVQAAACTGFCGAPPKSPIDLGVIIDRTGSMSASDLANAKAAARSLLTDLDPVYHHVALGVIHKSSTSSRCPGSLYGRSISTSEYNAGRGTFVAYPYPSGSLSDDYLRSDGTINTSSRLVRTIDCLETSSFRTAQGQTDIGGPIAAMRGLLQSRGRSGVPKVMLLETDGEANLPAGVAPCGLAVNEAAKAKAAGIELFTVGFGIAGKRCGRDLAGPYADALVTKVIADAATQPSDDSGCVPAENADGDHFFCEPKSGDLGSVFKRVVSQIVASPRLTRIPA